MSQNDPTRTVIVTGATRGIGLSIVEAVVSSGVAVEAWGRHHSVELAKVMERNPGRVGFRAIDFERDLERAIAAVRSQGNLVGLVNNAGVGATGRHELMASAVAQRVLHINLEVPMQLSRAAVRNFRMARRPGSIVNVSSIVTRRPYSGYGIYSSSKAGLESFSGVLAKEVSALGVRVNCVRPGFVETEMSRSLPARQQQAMRARESLPVKLRTEHVANVVAWLLFDAELVSGECISIGGV